MSPSFQSLGLDRLSRADRLALVQELWDSIANENTALPMSDALREELQRRAAEDDANPDDVIPWEQVRDEARRRFQT